MIKLRTLDRHSVNECHLITLSKIVRLDIDKHRRFSILLLCITHNHVLTVVNEGETLTSDMFQIWKKPSRIRKNIQNSEDTLKTVKSIL